MAIEKLIIPDFDGAQEITVVEVYIIALIEVSSDAAVPEPAEQKQAEPEQPKEAEAAQQPVAKPPADQSPQSAAQDIPDAADNTTEQGGTYHATPSTRSYAREHKVNLSAVTGTGPKGRIVREDIDRAAAGQGAGTATAAAKSTTDLVEFRELSRIQKISGPYLLKNWQGIPHVTQFEEADIEELEAFRKKINGERHSDEAKFSPLVFVVKAVVATLQQFPTFNASLSEDGKSIELKKYYNIGIAVDTPEGLTVPVVKHADQLSLTEIRDELQRLSLAARSGKLAINDIQDGTFNISSLGGIGGTGFTPIVSSPQVAVLGLSRSFIKPVYDGQNFIPRLTLPFSVSYDHRVI
ncbi:hypothetical protein CSA56_19255, partial [candidate division KSB3 bacterium]